MDELETIGADIEVFGHSPSMGKFVALCGKIGGTKMNPLQVKELPKGFMVQEDNVALEYNIPVCYRAEEFVKAVATMRDYCRVKMKSLTLELSPKASVSFPVEELAHPQAQVFGCEPDFNAWTKSENPRPESKDKNLRTCGGHVHVGTQADMVPGVRAMDLYLGVPSVLIDNTPEAKARRSLYGKYGAMRPKPYGFEYRVLSNFWMFEDYLVHWVYMATRAAIRSDKSILTKSLGNRLEQCINNGDEKLARELVKEYQLVMPNKEEYEKAYTKRNKLADDGGRDISWQTSENGGLRDIMGAVRNVVVERHNQPQEQPWPMHRGHRNV